MAPWNIYLIDPKMKHKDTVSPKPLASEEEIVTCVKAMAERIHEQESRIAELEKDIAFWKQAHEKEFYAKNDFATRLNAANEFLEREGKHKQF